MRNPETYVLPHRIRPILRFSSDQLLVLSEKRVEVGLRELSLFAFAWSTSTTSIRRMPRREWLGWAHVRQEYSSTP